MSVQWPEYLVTSRHEVVERSLDTDRAFPYGPWHAREEGAPITLCGTPAIEWRVFWSLDFDESGKRACPACLAAIRHRRGSRPSTRETQAS